MNISLDNKRAMVCGSTAGIGKAVAIELAGLGASVTLVAKDEEKLKKTLADLDKEKGQQHNYLVADFSKPQTLMAALEGHVETVNILVNNTGGPPPGPAYKAGTDEYINAFQQHLICNQVLVKHLIEGMKNSGYGRIINIISTSVKAPLDNLGVSNTIRGAVASWSKTLANELGEFGITVNNVLPGATETGRLEGLINKKAETSGASAEEVANKMKSGIPVKRFAGPEELAAAVAFLASPSAGYINGVNLPVDGGRTPCL
ncbi:MAG: SDR family oxidoreductase [Candidatus Cyclobacteriaceae bacterium M2_1C_046]